MLFSLGTGLRGSTERYKVQLTESFCYKDYDGQIDYDQEAGIFHGQVINLRDVITFQGTSIEELCQAFQDSVDDHLDFCARRGETLEDTVSQEKRSE